MDNILGSIFLDNILHLLPALLIALTIHEYAHGRVAYYLGDHTAKAHGRLTLNPLDHIDPIGLILLAIAGFGWAKPVPINPVNFSRRITMKAGMLYVSLAGPVSNLIMAFLFLGASDLYLRFFATGGLFIPWSMATYPHPTLYWIVMLNIFLAIFNLIPIPPLDGSKILRAILPRKLEASFAQIEQYGFIILILLIFTGGIGAIVRPLTMIILSIFHLPFQLF